MKEREGVNHRLRKLYFWTGSSEALCTRPIGFASLGAMIAKD